MNCFSTVPSLTCQDVLNTLKLLVKLELIIQTFRTNASLGAEYSSDINGVMPSSRRIALYLCLT